MQTVIGVFDDRSTAESAVSRLSETGFDREDIHLEPAGSTDTLNAGTTMGSTSSSTASTSSDSMGRRSGNDEKGVMESIGDFFENLFGGSDDSQPGRAHDDRYSEAVRRGSYVVVVDARDEDDAERASELLHELGAVDVDERVDQWRSTGWTGGGYNDSATPPSGQQMFVGGSGEHPQVARLEQRDDVGGERPPLGSDPYADSGDRVKLRDTHTARGLGAAPRDRADLQEERKLDVVQEELQIGKRTLDRGGVRVVQRMSEKPVREIVRLREEHAVVERRNVDREATGDDLSMGKDVVVEVHEKVEEPVVAKRARGVEEVVVGKEVREREETINETVRRKDVDVEKLDGESTDATRRNLEHAEARNREGGLPGTRRDSDDLGATREPKDLPDRRKL